MEPFFSVLFGGVSGATVVWLCRTWISERIRQDVQHLYAQKLEAYKAELNSRIQSLQHENQIQQLRTSLFFERQRSAFSALLGRIAEINRRWRSAHYEPGVGMTGPVPTGAYQELRNDYYAHQLFLDTTCLAALDLLFDCYSDSFPFYDNPEGPPSPRDAHAAFDSVEYLQPRIAQLFRRKIGVPEPDLATREIALLGAIRLLNRLHFQDVQLPIRGALGLRSSDEAADAVAKASENVDELISKLKQLHGFLRQEHGTFHEKRTEASRYLSMLEAGFQT